MLPISSLDQVFIRDGANNVIQIQVVFGGVTYVQNIPRDGAGDAISISRWLVL